MADTTFAGEPLRAAEHGILWQGKHGESNERRALLGQSWIDLRSTLERLLGRCPGGDALLQSLMRDLLRIEQPGTSVPLMLSFGCLSVVHTFALATEPDDPASDDEEPIVLVVGTTPLLFWSTERAREFARRATRRVAQPIPWVAYPGELGPGGYLARLTPVSASLRSLADQRRHGAHSELEERFCDALSGALAQQLRPVDPRDMRRGGAAIVTDVP